jgi:hypothetical protein
MIGTVSYSESTIEIIVLIISFVLSTLVWLECHVGYDIVRGYISTTRDGEIVLLLDSPILTARSTMQVDDELEVIV